MELLNNKNEDVETLISSNEIRVTINKPHDKVFEFTLEPKNTPKWIDLITSETVDTEQIGIGTIYTNDFGILTVTDYERNLYFELTNEKTTYQCSYSFKKIDDDTTEIIYFEAMLDGSELDEPFNLKHFEKLKKIMEK